jgi:hypothetical protein
MRCPEAYGHLLAGRSTAALPRVVRRHLQHCPRCLGRYRRLQALDQELRAIPLPAEAPAARDRLLRRLDLPARPGVELPARPPRLPSGLPQPARQAARLRGARRQSWPLLAGVAAAALAVGLASGWLLWGGRPAGAPPPGPDTSAAGSAPRVGKDVLALVLAHDLRLARTLLPAEQLQALAAMAWDLRGEAIRLARQGPAQDLPLVAGLYEQVVWRGLVGRARALPAGQRAACLPALAGQLAEGEREMGRLAGEVLPAVGEYLAGMASANREAGQFFRDGAAGPAPAPKPLSDDPSCPLLAALVRDGLRLAEEQTPLRRAGCCADLADRLARSIALASAGPDPEQAARLGRCLGDVLDDGVAGNLARVRVEDLDEAQRVELEQVHQRAGRATAVLEGNLAQAPAAAQPGLRRALEASRHGREQAENAGKGKGKGRPDHPGPPGKRGKEGPGKGKPFVPPGQARRGNSAGGPEP